LTRYVVDASVAVKWYVPEPHSEEALSLLAVENELATPDLLFAEIGSVLWKKIRRGELTPEDGQAMFLALCQTPIAVYSSEELHLAQESLRMATQSGCSFYDSLYVSLASLLGWPLVTADRRLIEKFSGVGGVAPFISVEELL
jgi:predicted nucleic acid-binding protein